MISLYLRMDFVIEKLASWGPDNDLEMYFLKHLPHDFILSIVLKKGLLNNQKHTTYIYPFFRKL